MRYRPVSFFSAGITSAIGRCSAITTLPLQSVPLVILNGGSRRDDQRNPLRVAGLRSSESATSYGLPPGESASTRSAFWSGDISCCRGAGNALATFTYGPDGRLATMTRGELVGVERLAVALDHGRHYRMGRVMGLQERPAGPCRLRPDVHLRPPCPLGAPLGRGLG